MAEVQQRRGIRVVFLVANTTTSGDQQRLEIEHEEEAHYLSVVLPAAALEGVRVEVVRDHEMRRAMEANVVDKMAVTPRLDLWGPLEHYPIRIPIPRR